MTTCLDCRHFHFLRQGNAERVGECRRNAPTPTTQIAPQMDASWPQVLESMSCGEFAPHPKTNAPIQAAATGNQSDEKRSRRTARRTRPATSKATR